MTTPSSPPTPIIPVCAAAVIRDGRVLVGRRGRGVGDPGRWELPGGKLLAGEDPRDCVFREILEEFGVRCRVGELLAVTNDRSGDKNVLLIVYRASVSEGTLSSSDHDMLVWADPDELAGLDFLPADRPVIAMLIDELSRERPR